MSAALKLISPEEYLAIERQATFRSEYRHGEMVMMAGASRNHNRVTANTGTELGIRLKKKKCQHFSQDFRVWIPQNEVYLYPDILVACGHLQLLDKQFDTLLNPTVIIEVLSKTTASYDRAEKFESYRSIESLQEYILIDSERIKVEVYQKIHGLWTLVQESNNVEESLHIRTIDEQIPLQDIYEQTVGLNE